MKRELMAFLGIVVLVVIIMTVVHFMQVPPREFVYQLF